MDNSTQRNELLMRYLDGEMAEGEKQDFEKLLAADSTLQEELESLKLAQSAVKSYGLKQQVTSVHKAMMEEIETAEPVKSINKVRRIVRYSVAVASSVLLIVGGYWVYSFYTLSPNKLYSDNYIVYELNDVRGDSISRQETAIEKAFRDKKFADVISLNKSTPLTTKDILLTGLSYLETGDPSRGAASFQTVLTQTAKDNSSMLKDQAEFYLAMAYLKKRDFDQAIELMIQIHDDPDHIYNEKITWKFIRKVKILKWR